MLKSCEEFLIGQLGIAGEKPTTRFFTGLFNKISKPWFLPIVICCILHFSTFPVYSRQLPMRPYTTDEGLVHNEVIMGYSSKIGYLWFATYYGVSRFDGSRFSNYTEKQNGLGASIIKCVTEDAQGNIWVGYSGGFGWLEGGRFVNVTVKEELPGNDVLNICPDPKQGIWLLTEKGVSRYAEGRFTFYPLKGVDAGYMWKRLSCSPEGDVFVATTEGLYIKKSDGEKFTLFSDFEFQINAIDFSPLENALYLIDSRNLYRFENGNMEKVAASKLKGDLRNLFIGKNQKIWINSQKELWIFSRGGETKYSENLFNDINITGVLEDREDNIWLTSWEGISMLLNTDIMNFPEIPLKTITKVLKDYKGNLWISGDKGLVSLDSGCEMQLIVPSSYVENMYIDGDNIYYCPIRGLNVINLDGRIIHRIEGNKFTCIAKDSAGKVWLGSYNGLYSVNDEYKAALELDVKGGLGSNTVWSIKEDSRKNLWIGTENGLSCKIGNEWRHFSEKDGFARTTIWHIYEDSKWGLLFATDLGIFRWSGSRFSILPQFKGERIRDLIADEDNRLWIATMKGIHRMSPAGDIDLLLDKSIGLPTNSVYIRTMLIDKPYLYVGTYKGMSRIELKIGKINKAKPIIVIDNVEINRKKKSISELSQPLNYFENNISFSYHAIYMYQPDKILFRYFLEGSDKQWNEEKSLTKAVYTHLPPGEYVFHIRAVTENGSIGKEVALAFSIKSAFWFRWWFITLALLLLVVVISCFFHFTGKRRLRKSEEEGARLHALFENMPVLIHAHDIQGNIVVWNRECERVTGYGRMELGGSMEAFRLLYPEDGFRRKVIARLYENAEPVCESREMDIECKDGVIKTIAWSNISMEYPIPGWRFWDVGVDVTERKKDKEDISRSLKEKEVLLHEIHHRVKNNLQIISSLLSMGTMQTKNSEAVKLLEEARDRIYSMALIHAQLYQSDRFDRVDFERHIYELVSYISLSYSSGKTVVTPKIEAGEAYLSIDKAIPCGLILNELISNVYKHAFRNRLEGSLYIGFTITDNEHIHVKVKDDGIGMPTDFELSNASTMGMTLIKDLVHQLKGELLYKSDEGAEFTITFKKIGLES